MKKTTTNHTQFELNGVIYLQTESGYCFTAEHEHGHNGYVKLNKRISKDAYNEAFEQYMEEQRLNIEAEMGNDEWEQEADTELAHRKDLQDKKDRETENSFNGKKTKKEEKLDAKMKKLGYHRIDSEWNDIRYSTCDGQSKIMAWNTVEEGFKWVKEQTKGQKASKPRRSKDVAYEGHDVTLTAKQVSFIRHLPDTSFWQDGLDSCVWVDCLCDDITGEFAEKPMTVGAMISTLCEKGLGERTRQRVDGRKCTSFNLTTLGKKIASDLGLA